MASILVVKWAKTVFYLRHADDPQMIIGDHSLNNPKNSAVEFGANSFTILQSNIDQNDER